MKFYKALSLLLSMTIPVNAASVVARDDNPVNSTLQKREQKELTAIYNSLDDIAKDLSHKCPHVRAKLCIQPDLY
jgi:hypothetical protein